MIKLRLLFSVALLSALALQTLACGSSSVTSNRVLQSMVITPANADAQNFPNGQVQFTATGNFNQAPSPAQLTFQPPYTGGWSLIGTGSASLATISQTGLAQCVPGAAGTVTVQAFASSNAGPGTQNTAVGVSSTTTLTCP